MRQSSFGFNKTVQAYLHLLFHVKAETTNCSLKLKIKCSSSPQCSCWLNYQIFFIFFQTLLLTIRKEVANSKETHKKIRPEWVFGQWPVIVTHFQTYWKLFLIWRGKKTLLPSVNEQTFTFVFMTHTTQL